MLEASWTLSTANLVTFPFFVILLSLNTIISYLDGSSWIIISYFLCSYSLKLADLRLEFAFIDGAESACRGSSASDNNPAHYKVVSGGVQMLAQFVSL